MLPYEERGISLDEMCELIQVGAKQKKLFEDALGTPRIWDAIREIYRLEQPYIERREYDPYIVDWSRIFTPIEFHMWCAIRSHSQTDLYPQYPVGRYFIDFADPWMMVGIECDGAKWHTDKAKDERRERELRKLGWSIYRITGRDCFSPDHAERSCTRLLHSIYDPMCRCCDIDEDGRDVDDDDY